MTITISKKAVLLAATGWLLMPGCDHGAGPPPPTGYVVGDEKADGVTSDPMEWDDITPATGPGVTNFSMALDPSRGRVVLFGGNDVNYNWTSGATWEFDLATNLWVRPPDGWGYQTGGPMVFDPISQRMLMFGSRSNGDDFAEMRLISSWDGARWKLVQTANKGPLARVGHSAYYDEASSVVVLFGGAQEITGIDSANSEIWNFDPATSTWEDLTTPEERQCGSWNVRCTNQPFPAPRYGHAMVYDPALGAAVLTGGRNSDRSHGFHIQPVPTHDSWLWNSRARSWTPLPAMTDLGWDFGMAYDSTRQTMIAAGGTAFGGGEYSYQGGGQAELSPGATWSWVTTPLAPVHNSPYSRLVYDPSSKRLLLFEPIYPLNSSATLRVYEYRRHCTPRTVAACTPTQCGTTIADRCGGTVACPACCVPATAASCSNVVCGSISDGCGGTVDCPACCVPETVASCTSATCGTSIPDGCGGTIACPACCTPRTAAACTDATCGVSIVDFCGGTIACPACPQTVRCDYPGYDLCGNDGVTGGDASTLYHCTAAGATIAQVCSAGCIIGASDDYCQ